MQHAPVDQADKNPPGDKAAYGAQNRPHHEECPQFASKTYRMATPWIGSSMALPILFRRASRGDGRDRGDGRTCDNLEEQALGLGVVVADRSCRARATGVRV